MPYLLHGAVVAAISVYIYFVLNDRKLSQLPPDAKVFSPNRFTTESVLAAFRQHQEEPIDAGRFLPPKTGRRYIVVGGVSVNPAAFSSAALTFRIGRLSWRMGRSPALATGRRSQTNSSPR